MKIVLEKEQYKSFEKKAQEQKMTTRELGNQIIAGWLANQK